MCVWGGAEEPRLPFRPPPPLPPVTQSHTPVPFPQLHVPCPANGWACAMAGVRGPCCRSTAALGAEMANHRQHEGRQATRQPLQVREPQSMDEEEAPYVGHAGAGAEGVAAAQRGFCGGYCACNTLGGVSGTVRARCGYWGCSVDPFIQSQSGGMVTPQSPSGTIRNSSPGRPSPGEVVQIPDAVRARCGYSPIVHSRRPWTM